MTSLTKPEVHNMSQSLWEEDPATATGNMHKKSAKLGCLVFDLCKWTGRQTADILITILRTKPDGNPRLGRSQRGNSYN